MKTKEQIIEFAQKKITDLEVILTSCNEDQRPSILTKINKIKWRIVNIDKYIEMYKSSKCDPKYQKEYRKNNKESIAMGQKLKYENKKDEYKKKMRDYYINNKEELKLSSKKYYSNNKDKVKLYPSQTREAWRERQKERLLDPHERILSRLRSRIYYALNGKCKSNKTEVLIGCTVDFFLDYIKSKLVDQMTWEEVLSGKIHIDHIRPCSSFNLESEEQQKLCFHYTNLQPLWSEDNLKKSDQWINIPL